MFFASSSLKRHQQKCCCMDRYSTMPYHYVTPKVGHLPPGLNQGGK